MRKFLVFICCFASSLPTWAQTSLREERLPVRMQGKWGCIDLAGKVIISPVFDYISTFKNGTAIAQKNGKLGVIDKHGNTLLPFEHLNLDTLSTECFATRNEAGKWGVIKINGEIVVPIAYTQIVAQKYGAKNTFFQARQEGLWDAYNEAGKRISTEHEAYDFYKPTLIVCKRNDKLGLVNINGTPILPTEYESFAPYPYRTDYFYVQKDKKFGLVTDSGKVIVPCEYDYIKTVGQGGNRVTIQRAENTLIEVGKQGKKGIFSILFEEILPAEYDDFEPHPQYANLITITKGGAQGLFDRNTRKVVLPCKFSNIVLITNDLAIISQEKDNITLSGAHNIATNKELISVQYNSLQTVGSGRNMYFIASYTNQYTIYNQQGRKITQNLPLDDVRFDVAGIFLLRVGKVWGLLNEACFVQPQFDGISPFKRNLALTRMGNLYGLINNRGQVIAPIQYLQIKMIGQTARAFRTDGSTDIITFDEQGNFVERTTYSTKLKTIGIKKDQTKVEEKKAEEWQFDLEQAQRSLPARANLPTQTPRRVSGIPTRSLNDFTFGAHSFVYNGAVQKWCVLRQSGDTLIPAIFEYVNEIPSLGFVQTAHVIEDTEGDTKGKKFVHWGLLDAETGKWIYPETKDALRQVEALLKDFQRGEIGRTSAFFLRKDGVAINSVKVTEKQKIERRYLAYCEPFDTLTNLAEFNAGGSIDKKLARIKPNVTNGAWGLMNRSGVVVSSPTYHEIRPKRQMYFVRRDNAWGVLDSTGREVVPCLYAKTDYVPNNEGTPMRDFILLSKTVERFGFLDSSRTIVIDATFKNAQHFREGFAPVMCDSTVGKELKTLWTFIDKQGNLLHPYAFREAKHFHEGLAGVKIGQKWGYLNTQGQIAVEPAYSQVQDFHEGKAVVRDFNTGKLHYINQDGSRLNELAYEKASNFEQGIAIAQDSEKKLYGLLQASGTWLLPPKYVHIAPFNEQGYAHYKDELGAKLGLLDRQGREITKAKYTKIELFEQGLARVAQGATWNFIDTTGTPLLKQGLPEVHHFEENLCLAHNGTGWGYLNRQGAWQILPTYERATHFAHHIAEVKPRNSTKNIYIDTLGNEVGKPKDWYTLGDFTEHKPDSTLRLMRIHREGRWGYWDRERQRMFLYPTYRKATAFYNGYARIEDLRGDTRYINTKKQTFRALPNGVRWFDTENDQFKTIRKNGLYGFATLQDFVYSEPKFAHLGEPHEDRILVSIRALYGVADRQGQILLQPIYERVVYMGADIFRVEVNDQIGYWHKTKGWLWEARK